jgi:5-formyltetrahydrofolate cyclo-ligase
LNYGLYLRDNQETEFSLNTMSDRYKTSIRQSCRNVRELLSPAYQNSMSSKICKQIKGLDVYRYAKKIALYHSMKGEVNLTTLWKTAPFQGKFCFFPTLKKDKSLLFLPATPATEFSENKYGIQEPLVDHTLAIPANEIDIIFLPLVAFDDYGTRLGMGMGYYDRTLENCSHPLLIGVAYDFQRQSYIQPQAWDISLAMIVTEVKIYRSDYA